MVTSRSERNQTPVAAASIPVMDYEGSSYRTDFWAHGGREYEDATERLALRRLLPATGGCIAEIGAGFGRLADLYLGYKQILLFDYSRTLLQEAVEMWGDDERFVFAAGNVYNLPLANGVLDSLVMVRVMHHLADVPAALAQLRRALHRESVAVIEYANKRNLKALLRWSLKQQQWSPLAKEPVEFVPLNYDFHPAWMTQRFTEAGLVSEERLGVSHFRLPTMKKLLPPHLLAQLDSALFGLGGHIAVAPSIFERLTVPASVSAPRGEQTAPGERAGIEIEHLFQCPSCAAQKWHRQKENILHCQQCGSSYAQKDGVWDFKDKV